MRICNQLDRWSLQAADQISTSSAAFVEELAGRVLSQAHSRATYADSSIRVCLRTNNDRTGHRPGFNDRTRVLLCVGRLSKEKGHADLVRAFAKIRELAGDPQLRLVLVGEGPERPRIEELCRSLDLTDAVTLPGQQDDIDPYYGIADVFLLPSHSEGCPNVLL